MGKTLIQVNCIDQQLLVSTGPVIASGGRNENEIVFSFCPLWDGFEKAATFYRDKEHVYPAVIDGYDKCVIPWEVLTDGGEFYFGIVGVKGDIKRTTQVVKYKVIDGAISENILPSDPTPDLYTQMVAAYNEATVEIRDHLYRRNNPHGVTADQVGALAIEGGTVTGDLAVTGATTLGALTLTEPLAVSSDDVASAIRKNLKIGDTQVDTEVTANGARAVSGAAVSSHVAEQIDALYDYGTTDLTAGVSTLATGKLYFVYE